MSALNWQRANADARMRRNGVETLGGSRSGRRLPPSKTPRSIPRAPKLAAPVVIAEFWVNRGGESLRIQLRAFAGRALFDARKYFTAADGTLQPSRKGFAIDIRKLPLLAKATSKALGTAIELGLIAADEVSDG
jgi:hypothetical protein